MHFLLLPLHIPLRILPDAIHAVVLAGCFNHLMRGQSLPDRLREIEGKSVCIYIRDADARIPLQIHKGYLRAVRSGRQQITISGNLDDFWQLATGKEDPDTLFFQRRLSIEGDTETGVHIKNLLDALEYDWDAHFDSVLLPPLSAVVKQLRRRVNDVCETKSYHRPRSHK